MKCKLLILLLSLLLVRFVATAEIVSGNITDAATGEPLIGASVYVKDSQKGVITDIDGNFQINLDKGNYILVIQYVGYITSENRVDVPLAGSLDIQLQQEFTTLDEVAVVVKKNMESEHNLLLERKNAALAIENIGFKEFSIKGVSSVQDGVKKLSGISIASSGAVVVRGLGDRYNATALNGLPIASPNPDNKLIPLDLFPASTVQNITVTKVYDASSFADYSGAHINISTKDNVVNDFFNVSASLGANINIFGSKFYSMNNFGALFTSPKVDPVALSLPLIEYDEYVKHNNIFPSDFDTKQYTPIPNFSVNVAGGKNLRFTSCSLNILAAANISNSTDISKNAYEKNLEATGNIQNNFNYSKYESNLQTAALFNIGLLFRKDDYIGYTLFYVRDVENSYQLRSGVDSEEHDLIGSNNTMHIYTLLNNQLCGKHIFGKWSLNWAGSYGLSTSDEPDRRQVMFENIDGNLSLFKLNRQETMRYFGSLKEDEWVARISATHNFSEKYNINFGGAYKDKNRDYTGIRFYYNINGINPTIEDPYNTSDYLNQENIENGSIVVERKMQPKDSYRAGSELAAAFVNANLSPADFVNIYLGVRYEYSRQWVYYASDGGTKYSKNRFMHNHDFFPALNVKFSVNEENSIRLAASRTVTRPLFVEMAPFLYQEAYGAAQIRGNAELQNGYNYNVDLKYEFFKGDNMFAATAYFKYLDNPIERVQELQGGATMHSFRNANHGIAAGIEVEGKVNITDWCRFSANISYMYTDVKLPIAGAYTNKERQLQGASPILANADITFCPRIAEERRINISLLYNLQGSRIHAVGVSGLGDVIQMPLHTLNLNVVAPITDHFDVKLKMDNILNSSDIYKQQIPTQNSSMIVGKYPNGMVMEIGFTYKL